MSIDAVKRTLVRRNTMPGAAYGQTYGAHGTPAYGPGTSRGWTGHEPSSMMGAPLPMSAFRVAPSGFAQILYGPAPIAYGAAPVAYGSGLTKQGGAIAAASANAGIGIVGSFLVAGTALSAVPVAGWIVAGGLIAAAGIIVLVDILRKKGTKAARAEALAKGYPQDFANEYAKLSTGKVTATRKAVDKWRRKITAERADVRDARANLAKKPNSKQRKNKYEKQLRQLQSDIDRLNAAQIVLGLQVTLPDEPVVAGVAQSVPVTAEERGAVGDAVEWAKSDGAVAVTAAVVSLVVVAGAVRYARSR